VRRPGWWRHQLTQLEHHWGQDGELVHDPETHRALWTGHRPHPRTGDPVGARILWGPGTPLFPPRIAFEGAYSAVHQLRDGSLCLLPPLDPVAGWEGPLDTLYWLKRADEWLERFVAEDWAIEPEIWQVLAVRRPGYRYRDVAPETRVIALPPEWAELPPGFGRVAVAVPQGPGLGAAVRWETLEGEIREWDAGTRLIRGGFDVLQGFWARLPTEWRSAPLTFDRPSLRRRYERLQQQLWREALEEGAERVTLMTNPLDLEQGASQRWLYRRLAAPAQAPHSVPLIQMLALHGLPKDTGLGIPLEREALDLRRRAGRSDTMHDAISQTQVVLAGLGSLGSELAHLLAQEGVSHFVLVDGDVLLPGNEARHRAGLVHAGRAKVKVITDLIHQVQPAAQVDAHQAWIDELAPTLGLSGDDRQVVLVGATGDEASEHFLGELAHELGVHCVHGWLEHQGRVLRAMRCLPELDPTISQVAHLDERPRLPRDPTAAGPESCADTVLPGSALDIHAAANFLVRVILDVVTGKWADENHWLFAPGGLDLPDAPAVLRQPYGVLGVALPGG